MMARAASESHNHQPNLEQAITEMSPDSTKIQQYTVNKKGNWREYHRRKYAVYKRMRRDQEVYGKIMRGEDVS